MLRFTSLLALSTGTLALQSTWPKFAPRSAATLDHLFGSGLAPRQGCDGDSQECADGCIPLDAYCCDVTIGIYCEAGETCTTEATCCVEGLDCDDSSSDGGSDAAPEDCADDEIFCGFGCIPEDAECCSEAMGMYCDPGYSCDTATTCLEGDGGSGGDDTPAEDESDDSSDDSSTSNDDDDEDDSGSSGGSSSSGNSSNGSGNNSNDDDEDEEDAASIAKPGLLIIALGAALALV